MVPGLHSTPTIAQAEQHVVVRVPQPQHAVPVLPLPLPRDRRLQVQKGQLAQRLQRAQHGAALREEGACGRHGSAGQTDKESKDVGGGHAMLLTRLARACRHGPG